MFEVNVSAGGLPEVHQVREREVCRRSAGSVPSSRARGLPEVGRECAKFESTEDHQRLLPTREEKYYSHTVG